ncbi:LLM class flavin-dependent oxidoreductase [Roseomonas sp. BN140053]|uniref:LLM class flavin-dependent oxidoreductase n=1 Tax=Roseomonas sp. BN140053 TaxID=3391898 RepID=UPI0039E7E51F
MKFFFFHLMPYADLDLSYADTHDSAWLTLPNRYFDPAKGQALYQRFIGELELADQLNFDGICVNEHHQTAYGIMPAPNLIAASLARTTKQAKIAVLGRALPLVNSPVAIAEEFAMLDNLSNGRLIAGFVRGIGSEYHASGVNPTLSHERFYEAHELILRAWTEREPFRFAGRHYEFEHVSLWPRPVQQPHPPVWIPSQGSTETIEWTAAAARKYTYLQTFSPIKVATKAFDAYREVARKDGYESQPSQLGWAVPIYVAETDEIARRELKPHVEAFFNRFLRFPMEMRMPPGYSSVRSTKALIESKFAARSSATTIDGLIELGMIVVGSPETVRQRLAAYHADLGFGNLIAMLQVASLPADLTEKNIRLFASEVMPHLAALGTDRDTAASPIAA